MAPLICEECGDVLAREVIPILDGFVVGTVCRQCTDVIAESRTFDTENDALKSLWHQRQDGEVA